MVHFATADHLVSKAESAPKAKQSRKAQARFRL